VVEHCCNAAPTPFEGLLHNNDLLWRPYYLPAEKPR
jgi:hypothetical protein